MKKFVFALVLGFAAAPVLAAFPPCEGKLMARFSGRIENVQYIGGEAGNLDHTTYGLGRFTEFEANAECPLDLNRAQEAVLWVDGSPSLHNDQSVDGILVYDIAHREYSIVQ